jgi:REP element-mobilizing transposase RayT
MANTYTQIHIQAVFAVRNRASLIHSDWKVELYKYMTTIIQNEGHKVLAINGVSDHIHILFGMRPVQSLSDLMKKTKGASSKWINEKGFCRRRFSWQEGYGAFSYSMSQLPRVIRYIQNQEEHHRKKTFVQEYEKMLKDFYLNYDHRYIFKEVI